MALVARRCIHSTELIGIKNIFQMRKIYIPETCSSGTTLTELKFKLRKNKTKKGAMATLKISMAISWLS